MRIGATRVGCDRATDIPHGPGLYEDRKIFELEKHRTAAISFTGAQTEAQTSWKMPRPARSGRSSIKALGLAVERPSKNQNYIYSPESC